MVVAVRVLCWLAVAGLRCPTPSIHYLASSFPSFLPLHLFSPSTCGEPCSPFHVLRHSRCPASATVRWRRLLSPAWLDAPLSSCARWQAAAGAGGCCRLAWLCGAFCLFLPAPFLFSFSFRIGGGLPSYPLPPGGWSVHSMIGLKVCDDGAPRSFVPGLLAPSSPVCPVAYLSFCLELWCVLSFIHYLIV